eukprot:2327933-Rhodomonas_salina.1
MSKYEEQLEECQVSSEFNLSLPLYAHAALSSVLAFVPSMGPILHIRFSILGPGAAYDALRNLSREGGGLCTHEEAFGHGFWSAGV